MKPTNTLTVEVQSQAQRTSQVRGYRSVSAYHFQQEGFASRAPAGSRALQLIVGGNAGNQVTLLAHRRSGELPVELAEGEALVYNADAQSYIHMKTDGSIDVKSAVVNVNADNAVNVTCPNVNVNADDAVNVTCPNVRITGDLRVSGEIHDRNTNLTTHDHQYHVPRHIAGPGMTSTPNP